MPEWSPKVNHLLSKCCSCGSVEQGVFFSSVMRVEAYSQNVCAFLNNYICIFYVPQVFNWRVVDCDLAIGLCTLLSKAEVFKTLWKVIDNTWQNYDKILVGKMLTVLLYVHVYVQLSILAANRISGSVLIISGCGKNRSQSLLLVQRARGTREVSFCHHWRWLGHQAWKIWGKTFWPRAAWSELTFL